VASRLRTADAPPFVGQIPLTKHERTAAFRVLEQSADPFATLCKLIERRAPLDLALIAGEVALRDDPTLHEASVYPLIERLLGKGVLLRSNGQREELVAAFRRACIQLSLTVQAERRLGGRQWRLWGCWAPWIPPSLCASLISRQHDWPFPLRANEIQP
jgi:hypothetical protein